VSWRHTGEGAQDVPVLSTISYHYNMAGCASEGIDLAVAGFNSLFFSLVQALRVLDRSMDPGGSIKRFTLDAVTHLGKFLINLSLWGLSNPLLNLGLFRGVLWLW
jgi:hypothetical protein